MSLPSPYLNARTVVDGVKVLGIASQAAKRLIRHHPALDTHWLLKPLFVVFQTIKAPIIGRKQPHCLSSLIPHLPFNHLKGQEFVGQAHFTSLKRVHQRIQGSAAFEMWFDAPLGIEKLIHFDLLDGAPLCVLTLEWCHTNPVSTVLRSIKELCLSYPSQWHVT